MSDKTTLSLPGRNVRVPKLLKRLIQIALAVAITSLVALAVIAGNALLIGRKGKSLEGVEIWMQYMNRADILATMILTAMVTVAFVYWQRDQHRS